MPILRYYDGTEWAPVDARNAQTLNGKTEEDFAPANHMGSPINPDGSLAHPLANEEDAGFMSPEHLAKLLRIREEYIVFSEVRPKEPFEGMVWYKPSLEDKHLFVDGGFQYITGGSHEKELTAMKANIIDLGIELETIKNAQITGVDANIVVESFQDVLDIDLKKGNYDAVNKRITL